MLQLKNLLHSAILAIKMGTLQNSLGVLKRRKLLNDNEKTDSKQARSIEEPLGKVAKTRH